MIDPYKCQIGVWNRVRELLQQQDDRLNDIIALTYDASLGSVSWELAIREFAILLDCQQCAVSIFDRELKARTFSVTAFKNNEYHRQFDDYFDNHRYLTRIQAENDVFRSADGACPISCVSDHPVNSSLEVPNDGYQERITR